MFVEEGCVGEVSFQESMSMLLYQRLSWCCRSSPVQMDGFVCVAIVAGRSQASSIYAWHGDRSASRFRAKSYIQAYYILYPYHSLPRSKTSRYA